MFVKGENIIIKEILGTNNISLDYPNKYCCVNGSWNSWRLIFVSKRQFGLSTRRCFYWSNMRNHWG